VRRPHPPPLRCPPPPYRQLQPRGALSPRWPPPLQPACPAPCLHPAQARQVDLAGSCWGGGRAPPQQLPGKSSCSHAAGWDGTACKLVCSYSASKATGMCVCSAVRHSACRALGQACEEMGTGRAARVALRGPAHACAGACLQAGHPWWGGGCAGGAHGGGAAAAAAGSLRRGLVLRGCGCGRVRVQRGGEGQTHALCRPRRWVDGFCREGRRPGA
jgi:hypothetical protein